MNKFALKLIIFLIIVKSVDLVFFSLFSWAQQFQNSPEEDYGSLNRMYQGLINTDIVFFGSSKTYLHINPEIIQQKSGFSAWNLGMDGANFEQHKFTLEEYILHNQLPKMVVFEANLESMNVSFLTFKTYLFNPYRNYSDHTLALFNQSWEDRFGYWFLSSSIYKRQISKTISDSRILLDKIKNREFSIQKPVNSELVKANVNDCIYINGSCLKSGQETKDLLEALSGPVSIHDLSQMSSRQKGFEELSKLAEEKGFKLILFTSPYLDGIIDKNQQKIASDFFEHLAKIYRNTYYINYANDKTFTENTDLWFNAGHLNLLGANLLSERLGPELKQILSTNKK